MKKKLTLISFICLTAISFSQSVNIPDPNFEQALIDLNIDNSSPTNQIDGILHLTPAVTGTSTLNISGKGITDLTGIEQFISLEMLRCENNNIGSVDFSNNQLLRNLFINNNNLTSLEVSQNSHLELLWCQSNQLSTLDLPINSSLERLECHFNNLTSLDLSKSFALKRIKAQHNNFASLDFSANTLLEQIDAFNCNLQSVNLDNCDALEKISLRNNNLTSLIIEDKPLLYQMLFKFNSLTELTVKNVDFDNFNFNLDLQGNPNLSCVEVSDPAYSNANWGWTDQVTYSSDCSSTVINIPDPNFEQYLIDENIDTDGVINAQIQASDALGVTSLIMNNLNISDLTGIEAFTDLEILTAVNNNLTTIDISQNTALTSVILTQNNLTSIDVSNNINLSTLNLTANNVSTLDLSNNTALTILDLSGNNLSSLDTNNLVSLSEFRVQNNILTSIDLSQNENLIQVACAFNNLTELNVQNGFNTLINNTFFDATNNPNLTCIQVDDVEYSNNTWTSIDPQTVFSANCNATFINIPDPNFEQALIDDGIDTDGVINGQMLESDALGVTNLNVDAQNISDLTGIEFFTDLETLFANGNNLSSLDLSKNTQLDGLSLGINSLTNIDLSNNINLVSLVLAQNQISQIDLSNNTALTQVFVQDNQLTEFDASVLPNLAQLNVSQNELVELDLSQNPALNQLLANNNNLVNLNLQNGNNTKITNASFDATANDNLFCIQVDDENYSQNTWNLIDTQSFFGFDCAPDNDDCIDAQSITLGQDVASTTQSSTSSGNVPGCQDQGLVIIDVWFQFVAPASGSVTLTQDAGTFTLKSALYENCTNLTPIACGTNGLQVDNLTPGQTYYVQTWVEVDLSGLLPQNGLTEIGDFSIRIDDTSTLSDADFGNLESSFKLFPNPASEFVNLSASQMIDSYEIFSINGKSVLTETNLNSKDHQININGLSKGIYLVKITSKNSTITKKLILK